MWVGPFRNGAWADQLICLQGTSDTVHTYTYIARYIYMCMHIVPRACRYCKQKRLTPCIYLRGIMSVCLISRTFSAPYLEDFWYLKDHLPLFQCAWPYTFQGAYTVTTYLGRLGT